MAVATSSVSNGRKPKRAKPKRRFPPDVLTDAEVRALIDACPSTSATGIRNRALLALLYRSGLRISEALDLYPKDVDLERGAIRVLHGKGDKARVVGVDRGGPSWNAGSTFAPATAVPPTTRSSAQPRASA